MHEADDGIVAIAHAKLSAKIEEFFGMCSTVPHRIDHVQAGI